MSKVHNLLKRLFGYEQIGNRPITEADNDFSRKGNQATKYKHTSKLVGKIVFAFLFHFYDTQISIHI